MRCVLLAALLVAAAHAAPESRPALRPRSSKSVGTLVAATPPAESKLSLRGGSKSLTDVAMPSSVALMIGAGGIFLSFSVFAVLQEDVYKKAYGGEYFAFTFFALLLERGINALTAFLGVTLLGKSGLAIPHTDIFISGVSQMLAMAASNEALRYVSYPTQVRAPSTAWRVCVPPSFTGQCSRMHGPPTHCAGAGQVWQDGARHGRRHPPRRQALLPLRVRAGYARHRRCHRVQLWRQGEKGR